MFSMNQAYCRLGKGYQAGMIEVLTAPRICDCSVMFPVGGSWRQRDGSWSRIPSYPEGKLIPRGDQEHAERILE